MEWVKRRQGQGEMESQSKKGSENYRTVHVLYVQLLLSMVARRHHAHNFSGCHTYCITVTWEVPAPDAGLPPYAHGTIKGAEFTMILERYGPLWYNV